jgi:RNA exonuclease 4
MSIQDDANEDTSDRESNHVQEDCNSQCDPCVNDDFYTLVKTKRRRKRHRRNRKRPWQKRCLEKSSQYVSLDCEMVGTGPCGKISCLARATIVDWYGRVVLETFVHPTAHVTDFRTRVSGIAFEDLFHSNDEDDQDRIMTIDDCRQIVESILYGKILIGHGLENDLVCLGIHHPWEKIRDTATYEPFMRQSNLNGLLYPRKLRDLYYENFQVVIQGSCHSSYEDAMAALRLYQLVQVEWEISHIKLVKLI